MAADEDNMQEYIEIDVGHAPGGFYSSNSSEATTTTAGANVYDAYITQSPWLPGVQQNLEDMTPWVKDNDRPVETPP